MLQLVDDEKEMQENLPVFFPDADIQGVIVIGEMKAKFIRNMKNQICVPLVCIDFYGMEEDIDYIVPDNFHGSAFLTQTLVDAGHKDIGFIGTPTATNSIMDRYMGYCKALAENGLSERRKWLIFDRQEDGYGYKVDFELPDELPTAFVCNCDKTAYLLIAKLKEKDLAVPEDISVVGFDNSYPERGEKKKLVTYEVDTNAMAQIGVNTLLKRMEGKGNPEKIRMVESRIIEGDTVEELRR